MRFSLMYNSPGVSNRQTHTIHFEGLVRAMSRVEKPVVLLVDDNEATSTLVTAILQRDYAIDVATNGLEALEQIKTRKYAVILLDLRMPGLDGFGVLASLQKNSPDLLRRVLVLTAAVHSRDMSRVKMFEVCGVIAKPFEVEALLAAVNQCAGPSDGSSRMTLLSSGVILLLADLLRQVNR